MLRRIVVPLAVALLAPAAALAQAPAPQIDGSPLNVWATPDGRVQVALDGAPGEFFAPGSADSPGTTPNAGFGLVLNPSGSSTSYGPFVAGGLPDPSSGPTVTPGNPTTVTTTWALTDFNSGPTVELTQQLKYANGSRQVDASYTVRNTSGGPLTFRALWAADLAIRGSDAGVAFLLGGPPRFMGGLNQEVGAAGGFVEQTPWSAFMSNGLGLVGSRARADGENPGLDNSLSADLQDNAAGVEWDDHYSAALPSGGTATYNVGLRFVDTLGISPLGAQHQIGDEHVVSAKLSGLDGQPQSGARLVWSAEGANSANGTATTDRNGNATFSYVGGNAGQDNLIVFADTNRNGQHDGGEPQASTIVNWDSGGVAPPILGQAVDVRPENGTVRVQLARGTSVARAKALGVSPAATKKFVPLRAGLQIPVGSLLDTRRGTVRLLSAALPTPNGSAFQAASFRGTRFQVRQAGNNPLTQLLAKEPLSGCKTKVPKGGLAKVVASRKRSRTLFGSGKGRFRTRGRNSSATVRGTTWVQKDTCSGTLTSVKAGTVVVRDFAKHRNITIKAPGKRKSYFARARPKR